MQVHITQMIMFVIKSLIFKLSKQVDRTETVNNCQDPEFSKRLSIDYHFEKVQKLKFGIYDIDNKSVDLKDDDFLGGFECNLGQV